MILNVIQQNDFEFYEKIKIKIYPRLISILSFNNKSLTISMLSFLIAECNGASEKYIIVNFIWNEIEKNGFEFH